MTYGLNFFLVKYQLSRITGYDIAEFRRSKEAQSVRFMGR
jgi:hypothetical protein